jgi:hypothetical protein
MRDLDIVNRSVRIRHTVFLRSLQEIKLITDGNSYCLTNATFLFLSILPLFLSPLLNCYIVMGYQHAILTELLVRTIRILSYI